MKTNNHKNQVIRHGTVFRACLLLVACMLIYGYGHAQNPTDSLNIGKKLDSITLINPTDTLSVDSLVLLEKIDLVKLGIVNKPKAIADSLGLLKAKGVATKLQLKLDSTGNLLDGLFVNSRTLNPIDSLKPNLSGDSLNLVLTSKSSAVNDSVNAVNQYLTNISNIPQNQIDKFENRLDSASLAAKDSINARVDRKIKKLQNKQEEIGNLSNKGNSAFDTLTSNVIDPLPKLYNQMTNDVINKLNADTNQDLKVPGFEIAKTPQSNDLGNSIPDIDNPKIDIPETSGINTSQLPNLPKKMPKLNLPQIENPLDGYKEKVNEKIEGLKGVGSMDDGKQKIDQIKQLNSDVSKYKDQFDQIKQGNTEEVEEELNSRLNISNELNLARKEEAALLGEKQALEEQLKMMRELQDEELLKKSIEEKIKNKGTNYFRGKENELLAAHNQIADYKKKYEQVSDIKALARGDIKGTKINRFPEMLIAGSDFEIIRDSVSSIDISPYLGYKMTDKWHLKINHIWRFNATINSRGLEFGYSKIRGWNSSLNYDFHKGFIAVIGYETRTFLFQSDDNADERRRSDYIMAGIRKKYKIFNSIYGDGQVLYNFNVSENQLNRSTIHLRIGVYLDFKAKKKR
ncbi:MAG: hypothetical protein AAFQ94_25165 [Bacteroidota bacterium]